MSRTFDSLGLLTASAEDAVLAWHALSGKRLPVRPVHELRLGRPRQCFYDNLAPEVASCTERALEALSKAGAEILDVDVPALDETDFLYTTIARAELMATLGSVRFQAIRGQLNPDVAERIAEGLDISAEAYLQARWRREALMSQVAATFIGLDAWIGPVKQNLPPIFSEEFKSLASERAMANLCMGPTRQANVFGLCASSQPIHRYGTVLPVGLQLLRPSGDESALLSVAQSCEGVFGKREPPDMRGFLSST